MRERFAVAAEHEAARGVTIEPMRQSRRTRQTEAQCIEIVLEGVATLRTPVHRQSRRFVNDQHQTVAIEQASDHLFRCHAETAITGAT